MTENERLLRAGGLAVVPTDTVYGIGCAAALPDACARLYRLKERPARQPTAVVFGSVATAEEVLGEPLPRDLLPGPITLIVPNPGGMFAHLCGSTPARRPNAAPGATWSSLSEASGHRCKNVWAGPLHS